MKSQLPLLFGELLNNIKKDFVLHNSTAPTKRQNTRSVENTAAVKNSVADVPMLFIPQ